ncbi:MAG: hypothetical protein ACRDVN_07480 [Jiangellaceae bacterium]
MSRRRCAPVFVAAAALVAASCGGGGGDEPAGLRSESAPTPDSASEVPSAASTPPGPSDADLGLTVTELPDVSPQERAAMDTYLAYVRAQWRTLTENQLDPSLEQLATADVVGPLRDQVQNQQAEGFHLDGSVSVDVQSVDVGTSNVAVVSACYDQSGVMVVRAGKSATPSSDSAANPTFLATADLSPRGAGLWIAAYRTELRSC